MDEIHANDGRNVQQIGLDPYLDLNWERIFERIAGSADRVIRGSTLAHFLNQTYHFDMESAELIPYLAYSHCRLLRIYVSIGEISNDYYLVASDDLEDIDARVVISSDIFYQEYKEGAPEELSRNELQDRIHQYNDHVRSKDVQKVVDNIEYLDSFEMFGEKIRMTPAAARVLLMYQAHDRISEATSCFTPADEGPTFIEVMEALADYEQAKKALY